MTRHSEFPPPEDGRCPICRLPLVNLERGHIGHCMESHGKVRCRDCGEIVGKTELNTHKQVRHSPRSATEPEDAIQDEGELVFDEEIRRVPWHILPPGPGRGWFRDYVDGLESRPTREPETYLQRLRDVYDLGADEVYVGEQEYAGYFVFVFREWDTAVFESPEEGNATYAVEGPWRALSRLNKADLQKQATRLLHTRHWLGNVRDAIRDKFIMDF